MRPPFTEKTMTCPTTRAARNDLIIRRELAAHGSVCACGCGAKLIHGAYHWHHTTVAPKRSEIANLRRATATVLITELGKCVPMAASCHLKGQHHH